MLSGRKISVTCDRVGTLPVNRQMARYNELAAVPYAEHDFGFLRTDLYTTVHLYNPGLTPLSVTQTITGDSTGIFVLTSHEGVEVVFPLSIPARSSVKLYYKVTLEGQKLFDVRYSYTDGVNTQVFRLRGMRAPMFLDAFARVYDEPNWARGLTEILEWNTDVLISHGQQEQRVSLRPAPVQKMRVEYLVKNHERRVMERKLSMRTIRFFHSPFWWDAIGFSALQNETTILVDTNSRHFLQDRTVVLESPDGLKEMYTIVSLSGASVVITPALTKDYPVGSWMYPSSYFKASQGQKITRHTGDISKTVFTYTNVYSDNIIETITFEKFKNEFVFPLVPTYEQVTETQNQEIEVINNPMGVNIYDHINNFIPFDTSLYIKCFGRSDIDKLKQFLYHIKGRFLPFWTVNPQEAIELVTPIALHDVNIVIRNIGYSAEYHGEPGKRFLEFALHNGNIIRREITSSIVNPVDEAQEILSMDSPFAEAIPLNMIKNVSFFIRVRLVSDRVQLNWKTGNCLECKLPVREIKNII